MSQYEGLSREELLQLEQELQAQYKEFQAKELKLDMSRGKPASDQLELSMGMLDAVNSSTTMQAEDGTDLRNYGILDGIPEAKRLFAELLGVNTDEVIVGGNASLNIMYDTIARAMLFGVPGSKQPWCKLDTVKFLCPAPGYDRHFSICDAFGIEMIGIEMNADGPDMDAVEKLVSEDESIKGIWCVPKYSNPQGITYSDEVVRRFAALKPAASDFRILWDNAYCVHDLNADAPDVLLNIVDECKKNGTEDSVLIFASTSKVSFSGAGVAVVAGSKTNISAMKKQMGMQTIGFDKINQFRHSLYFKDVQGICEHMKKHAALLRPKFQVVLDTLETELGGKGIASWTAPNGGYFISVDTLDGCAKEVVRLCREAGVVLTGAGATFPYGKDPRDRNIRVAPTYPPVEELRIAIALFCLCVKLASVEKLLKK